MQNNNPTDIVVPAPGPVQSNNVTYYPMIEDEEGLHLRDYWHIFAKRKWWFFGVLSGMVLVTALVCFLMSPIYMSTVTLQITADNPSALLGGAASDPLGAISGGGEMDRFYETQNQILQSFTMAYGLIDSLKLKDHPSYKKMEKDNKDDPPEVIRQKYAQDVLDHLKVEPIKNSFLVNVSFRSTDKNLARQVPEAIQTEYLKLSMATRQQSYSMLRNWLDGELVRLGNKLQISEQNVYTEGQKSDFMALEDGQYNVIVQKYVDLSRMLTTAQTEKAGKEATYRQIKEKGVDAPAVMNNSLIQGLRNQLISLETQASGSGEIFGAKFPERQSALTTMKDLRERLGQEVKRLETSIRADYETASRAEALIHDDYEIQKAKLTDLQTGLVQFHMLKRDLQTNQTLYEALLARMKDASIAASMVSSNISVITPAEQPYKPWIPRPLLFVILAVVMGSMAGVCMAFFVEYLDRSIKSAEEMEKVCRIPSLGVVPLADSKELRELGKDSGPLELLAQNAPMSIVSEAVFHIRTAIMLSASLAPPQVIALTSPSPGEGKTTISSNLAASLAGSEHKCLIIDCDVRKPRVHQIFKQSKNPGLTNYLTGSAELEEIIRPTDVPNLFYIAAGPVPPNPNELFASSALRDLIDSLRSQFDYIVIDSPPVIGFADARSLSGYADGVVLVIRHHSTTRDSGRLATQLLCQNNCRILGGILSMAMKNKMGQGGYYGYYRDYEKHYRNYRNADESGGTEKRKLFGRK